MTYRLPAAGALARRCPPVLAALALALVPAWANAAADAAGEAASEAAEAAAASLEGSGWRLARIVSNGGQVHVPANPGNYILRFRSEQRARIVADCNQAGATWQQDGAALTLTQLVTTRKLCPPGSLFNRYIMNLEGVRDFAIRDGKLYLGTAPYGNTLEFDPL